LSTPFRVGVLDLDRFTDRDTEVDRVKDTMRSGGRLVVLGERRLGKTFLIQRAAQHIAAAGGSTIYLDLWASGNEAVIVREFFRQIPVSWLAGERVRSLLRWFAGMVQLGVDPVTGNPRLHVDPGLNSTPNGSFVRAVRALDAFAAELEGPVTVVFDEFQKSEERLDLPPATLRALSQECTNLGFVFSGSAMGVITGYVSPDGPFHGTPTLEVQPIDPDHLSAWIRDVLRENRRTISLEVARQIVDVTRGVTAYTLTLANRCAAVVVDGDEITAAVVRSAFESLALDSSSQFEILWDQVNGTQRAVLIATAWGEAQLMSSSARNRYSLPAPSTVASALKSLRGSAYIRPQSDAQIADPFFAEWIRSRNPPPAGTQ
jgi:hypothetical protein